jgi:hypothetical protein
MRIGNRIRVIVGQLCLTILLDYEYAERLGLANGDFVRQHNNYLQDYAQFVDLRHCYPFVKWA